MTDAMATEEQPRAAIDVATPRGGPDPLFGSLFLGGFECSSHLTIDGHRMDLIAATQHDRLADADYERCRAVGIRAVRESARWPIADRRGRVDTSEVRRLARLARTHGLTPIWDLVHYGYPADLDPGHERFGDDLVDRLQAFAAAVARVVNEESDGPTWYTPVNEISYTAWAAGDVGLISPFWHGRGWEYKVILVRAAIAAFDAIRSVDPSARAMSAEPLVRIHVHPAISDEEERRRLQGDADDFNQRVVPEAYDMLAGRVTPELGGTRDHLGVVGVNYYEGNQWTIATPSVPQHFLGRDDPAWLPLRDILRELADRYAGPVVISETGSTARARASWLGHLTEEAEGALRLGVDLQGICLYPIVTSPDWNDPTAFFEGGLWDVEPRPDGRLERVIAPEVAMALHEAQLRLDPASVTGALVSEPEPPLPEPDLLFAKPLELARFSPDGFVSVPLFAGDSLVGDLYCLEPGKSVAGHRHADTEHVLTAIQGRGDVRIGETWVILREGESVLVPAATYHGLHNPTTDRLIVQQVSSPKPWDSRYGRPRPSDVRFHQQPAATETDPASPAGRPSDGIEGEPRTSSVSASDLVCFSQLRWDFVRQRPQHLMGRAARDRRVWYIEEPVFEDDAPRLIVEEREPRLTLVRPVVPSGRSEQETDAAVSRMLQDLFRDHEIDHPVAWYFTPLAVAWTRWLEPAVTVYDCMDELSAFRFAPPRMLRLEAELLASADVVFTGGQSLFQAKRTRHPNVHAFPSAVDAAHFGTARGALDGPPDQRDLPAPRIGWFGVIDERVDLDLIAGIADLRPDWSFVLIGPIVKIDSAAIPARPNVHLLGARDYEMLPRYIAGWEVAMMPFARNWSTRFISPTKTLEYLAAGRPVVSTSIEDVVPYERSGLVRIADSPSAFVAAIEAAIGQDHQQFLASVDAFLARRTWDDTWRRMWDQVEQVIALRVPGTAPAVEGRSDVATTGSVAAVAGRR